MKAIINKILVAVSGSESSVNAAKYAIMLAKTYKLELSVLYVVDTSTIKNLLLSKIFIEEESQDFEKSLETNGNRYLDYIEDLAKDKKIKINRILKRGSISSTILETSDEIGAEMIVLGGWEVNRSRRDLISKAHMDIIMDSKKTVLIVKEENIEDMFKKFK